jgi:hypothetical protein
MRWETPIRIELDEVEREELEVMARSHVMSHGEVVRAKIILGVAAGRSLTKVGQEVGCGRRIVRKWAQRFGRKRLAGLSDEPRTGRRPVFPPSGSHSLGKAGMRAT